MKTKLITILLVCFIGTNVFSQTNLNEYKYVIVPKKFDFLKEADQYQLNGLTEFLFEKYGFTALMEGDDYPADLTSNRCLGLRSNVLKDSGLFKTKLNIELKDCNDRVVFLSEVGESREKQYKVAYNEALRSAFKSFEAINYSYEPKENTVTSIVKKEETQVAANEEIEKLKEEIKTLKEEKKEVVEVKPVVKEEIVETPKAKEPVEKVTPKKVISNVLYAQEIENGFQLVDSSPKVVYKIKSTSLKDVFLVEGRNGIVYKKGSTWVLEFYADDTLLQEELNIKF